MTYIKQVILKNFQSHKNSTITFNNRLNVIVGPSDSGKTAILRGIRWALYNEPVGDYFIREGEKECSVTIVFSNYTTIKRYRSKNKNIYYLYDKDNIETKFEGFGTTVPQEIIDKVGIKKIELDNDISKAINFSDQLEGAFLLSERGAVRANSIGRLVGVNIIDDSLRETLRDIRNLSGNKRYIDNNIIELEKELKEYDYLEQLQIQIENIEDLKNEIYQKEQLKLKYSNILNKILIINKEKNKMNIYTQALNNVSTVDNIVKYINLNIDKYKNLNEQNRRFLRVAQDKKDTINTLSNLKDINIVEGKYTKIASKSNYQIQYMKVNSKLNKNLIEMRSLQNILENLNNLEELQSLIIDIEMKITSFQELKKIRSKEIQLTKSLKIGNEFLNKLCYTDQVWKIYESINQKYHLLIKLKPLLEKYIFNTEDILKLDNYLIKLNKSFDKDLSMYKDILLNQETCPLCFSNIDKNKIENIINHYN